MTTRALMLQIVPPSISPDPAAAPDPVTVVSELMRQIADAAVPQVHAAGMGMWRGLAAILIVWTGLRIAFTGDFRPWEIVRIVIGLWFPWVMLTFYDAPLPGSTLSFTTAITGGGNWLQAVLIGNTGQDFMREFTELSQRVYAQIETTQNAADLGVLSLVGGLSSLLFTYARVLFLSGFLLTVLFCLIVIYAVTMAQVLWAAIAVGILLILGPIFIPFLLVEPLAFLFWGWFKGMFTYVLYGAIAAALMRVFMAVTSGWIDAIMVGPPAGANPVWHSAAWLLSILPLMVAALFSSLQIGALASQIVGGGGGGGGMMGLVGQAAGGVSKLKGV